MTGDLGLGIGWRPQLAGLAIERADLGFVEIVSEGFAAEGFAAEGFAAEDALPLPLEALRRRGVRVVPHGIRLSLGGADEPDPGRLDALARLAERVDAPLVSEHIAFVRGGGVEVGHLLPVPRTRAMLEVLVDNVGIAAARLPVPLALEPIATVFDWPDAEIDEGAFVTELLERTDTLLLLDVANLYANARNHGYDPVALLDRLPLDRLAYVHVAGGVEQAGLHHDTHAHPVAPGVLDLLAHLAERRPVPGVMLERDSRFPPVAEMGAELDAIAAAARLGVARPTTAAPRAAAPPTSAAGLRRLGASPSVTDDIRRLVAADQASLVKTVVGGAAPPAGFDPARVKVAAAALMRKRSDEVARACPELADGLGETFPVRFAAYAADHAVPSGGGTRADAAAFTRWLRSSPRRRRPAPVP